MNRTADPFQIAPECRFLVIGDPVAHSRSPELQNAGLAALGFPARYGKLAVRAAELATFAAFARARLDGFNVTVPHKKTIIPLLDEVDPDAAAAGSVNTVAVRGGRLLGSSTDGYGLETAIREDLRSELAGQSILLIGAGGAARAIAFHLGHRGALRLAIANRTIERAETLRRDLAAAFPGFPVATVALADRAAMTAELAAAELVIQAGSLGLAPDDPPPFDLELLAGKPQLRCFETIYRPTPFLRQAQALKLPAADGRGMLLHQGCRSLEIWTGRPAPIEAMRQALERSLICCD